MQVGRLLAQAYLGAKRPDEAVAILEEERKRRPDDPSVTLSLATTLADAGREPQAMALLAEAEPTFRDQVIYWFQRGAILERFHRRPEAKAAFRKALEVEPAHAPTLNYLGYMLVEDGGPMDEAVLLIEKALTEDPDNGSYLDSLGWAYFKQGRPAEARSTWSGLRISKSNSVIQDHLGDVLQALNDGSGAIAAWERALAGDGESVERRSSGRRSPVRVDARPPVIRRAIVASTAIALLAMAACAPKVNLALPAGAGTPVADLAVVEQAARASCRMHPAVTAESAAVGAHRWRARARHVTGRRGAGVHAARGAGAVRRAGVRAGGPSR